MRARRDSGHRRPQKPPPCTGTPRSSLLLTVAARPAHGRRAGGGVRVRWPSDVTGAGGAAGAARVLGGGGRAGAGHGGQGAAGSLVWVNGSW